MQKRLYRPKDNASERAWTKVQCGRDRVDHCTLYTVEETVWTIVHVLQERQGGPKYIAKERGCTKVYELLRKNKQETQHKNRTVTVGSKKKINVLVLGLMNTV